MESATVELDFQKLARYAQRRFVPDQAGLGNVDEVVALYRRLLNTFIGSAQNLETWLQDRSELEAALEQHGTLLYIRMTCQTDDEARAKAYRDFIEQVVPAVKPLADQLNLKYLGERRRFPAGHSFYALYDRKIESDTKLFCEENVPLQTKESLLAQDYQTVCGAMTVTFDGAEKTLPQMGKYLFETDRAVREAAWRATVQRRFLEKDKLDDIFDQMLLLRQDIAKNAGSPNFVDYQFKALHRFDYSPVECRQYHAAIEELVLPVWQKILEKRKRDLKLDKLRPWDLQVDALGRPALLPFADAAELIKGVGLIMQRNDPELGKQFTDMSDLGLLDLASRKGKAPGGYQSTLTEARQPFIFMNAVGIDDDVYTLLHEAGHAFHALACASQPLFDYRHAPMEFCEVASMSMELLGKEFLDVFYSREDLERSKFSHYEDIVSTLVWVATIDAFQLWIYEHPNQTRETRRQAWLSIRQRFGGDLVDWEGLEAIHGTLWHRQLHIFEVPFYYIEYGIAQLGALQLWQNARRDRKAALEAYKKALSFGGARPLPELFQAAGLRFEFSAKTIAPLMNALRAELKI